MRKPAYADPNYRPFPESVESHTQLYPRKSKALDIDSLVHNIDVDFEENSHIKKE